MGLTSGSGPFGDRPASSFNFTPDPPTGSVLFFEPVPYRLRGFFAGESVFDTLGAKLLYETAHLPVYYVPEQNLRHDLLDSSDRRTRCPHKGEASYRSLRVGDRFEPEAVWTYREPIAPAAFLAGYAAFYWAKLDRWFVEDEQVLGHPRDPYHRIDTFRISRPVRVSVDDETVAESTRTVALFESGLPARFYLPAEDVRTDLLEPSETKTRCAYKGVATYWHVRVGHTLREDLAWTYAEPERDGAAVRGLICFFNERVDLEVDGDAQERPVTRWSH
ncbi:MAG: DUF427 domain-containing protein [Gaiellaceae bacterium]